MNGEAYKAVSEKDLQSAVMEQLRRMGWKCYHTFDSRRSEPGYPDLTAVKGSRLMFVEFKTEAGKVKASQIEWLDALIEAHDEVYLVRPSTQDAFMENVNLVGTNLETYWRNVRMGHGEDKK